MSFAIMCDSQFDDHTELGLVDRKVSRRGWWTSDDSSLLKEFSTHREAEDALARIRLNSPRIVGYEEARNILDHQLNEHLEADSEEEAARCWDAHEGLFF